MAWFIYNCPIHREYKVSLEKRVKTHLCPICGCETKVVIKSSGTTQTVEVLDNGIMARKIERLHNIEEMLDERAEQDTKRFKEKFNVDDEDN